MGLFNFIPKPRKVPPQPPSQQPFSPSPFFRKPTSQPDQKKSGGTSSQQQQKPQKSTSRFQNSFCRPPRDFEQWLLSKWPSPSEANILQQTFREYWSPTESLTPGGVNSLKNRLWRDANYDEDLTKRKWADKLLKAIEKFEKGE